MDNIYIVALLVVSRGFIYVIPNRVVILRFLIPSTYPGSVLYNINHLL